MYGLEHKISLNAISYKILGYRNTKSLEPDPQRFPKCGN